MAARGGPTRAGSALLSGMLICGRCGLRMKAQYTIMATLAAMSGAP